MWGSHWHRFKNEWERKKQKYSMCRWHSRHLSRNDVLRNSQVGSPFFLLCHSLHFGATSSLWRWRKSWGIGRTFLYRGSIKGKKSWEGASQGGSLTPETGKLLEERSKTQKDSLKMGGGRRVRERSCPRATLLTVTYLWHIRSSAIDSGKNREEGLESAEILEKLLCGMWGGAVQA